MVKLAFAARVLYATGEAKPQELIPANLPRQAASAAYLLRNPFTGRRLWVSREHVVNVVDHVATVALEAPYSGRLKKITPGHREFLNPLTGNTFLASLRAIIKETA